MMSSDDMMAPKWVEDDCSCPACGWKGKARDAVLNDLDVAYCPNEGCGSPVEFADEEEPECDDHDVVRVRIAGCGPMCGES